MRPIETIRLSQQAKDKLVKLKRLTGLKQWNVLCRWAFCRSLAEATRPPRRKIALDSSVEMTWKVFAGKHEALYLALLRQRCLNDGFQLDDETLGMQFRLHLHRGIDYLAADKSVGSIAGLVGQLALAGQDAAA